MPPIAPSDVINDGIPDYIFDTFNKLIKEYMRGGTAQFSITVVENELGYTKYEEALKNKWLDVESSYRAVGWEADWEKPDYGPGTFTFTKPF